MDEIGLCVGQNMDLAESDFPDGGELLHKPCGIVPALLDNSDQTQCIEGAERMPRSLGFDLVLSRCDVCIGVGRVDDLVIRQHVRSEEHTSELQSHVNLVCRLLLEKKNKT